MAKREVWIEEEEGRTTGAWFNKALAMRHVRNGCKVTRYVPDEPEAVVEVWWGVTDVLGTLRAVVRRATHAKALKFPKERVVAVRVVPVEVKARKRKGGAK